MDAEAEGKIGTNYLRCVPGLVYPSHFKWEVIKPYPNNQTHVFAGKAADVGANKKRKRETSGRDCD